MSQVILEKLNNKKRTCKFSHSDGTRTNAHWPLPSSHSGDLTNEHPMENKKTATVLERFEYVLEKLKNARREIVDAILAALEMKEASNDIANQMIIAMVAQDRIRNVEISMDQTRTKITHEMFLQKKDVNMNQGFGIKKDASLAEEPLYLARYE